MVLQKTDYFIMKKKPIGSSETTREASIYSNKNAFLAYIPHCPQHKKIDPVFLAWFIGFLEGDGNFQDWLDNGSLRFAVRITQKDELLLHSIRTQLGFGKIAFVTANNGIPYPQLGFESKQNIIALLHLCAGNLRLRKVQVRFHAWAEKVCEKFQFPMPSNPQGLANQSLSLEDSWISGFFQADGGFHAQYRSDKSYHVGYRVALRAYFDQKHEQELLTEIATVLGGSVKPRKRGSEYFRLNIGTDFDTLITYLTRFPLRGGKKIAQSRWFRVYNYLQTHELPEIGTKSHKRFKRLVDNVNEYQRGRAKFL